MSPLFGSLLFLAVQAEAADQVPPVAIALSQSGDFRTARSIIEKQLARCEAITGPSACFELLIAASQAQLATHDYPAAWITARRAATHAQATSNPLTLARSAEMSGSVALAEQKSEVAELHFVAAIDALKRIDLTKSDLGYAIRFKLLETLQNQGRLDEIEISARAILSEATKSGRDGTALTAMGHLARAYSEKRDFGRSLQFYGQILNALVNRKPAPYAEILIMDVVRLARTYPDLPPLTLAMYLNNAGAALTKTNRCPEAAPLLIESIRLLETVDQKPTALSEQKAPLALAISTRVNLAECLISDANTRATARASYRMGQRYLLSRRTAPTGTDVAVEREYRAMRHAFTGGVEVAWLLAH